MPMAIRRGTNEMLRVIVKWMISRSIDEGRPVPAWVRRKIDGDQELKQFELRSRQLGLRLKSEADGWIARQSTPVTEPSLRTEQVSANKSLRRMMWFAGAGVAVSAATIGLTVALNRSEVDSPIQTGPDSGQSVAATKRTVETDLEVAKVGEWLIQSVNKSHATFEQLHSRTPTLPIRFESLKLPTVAQLTEPAKVAGSTASQAFTMLDRGLETEQKRLTSEVRSAFSFFTYRLPMSLAKLAGRNPEG